MSDKTPQLDPATEAEARMFYRRVLKSYGKVGLLEMVLKMQLNVRVALDVLQEDM